MTRRRMHGMPIKLGRRHGRTQKNMSTIKTITRRTKPTYGIARVHDTQIAKAAGIAKSKKVISQAENETYLLEILMLHCEARLPAF